MTFRLSPPQDPPRPGRIWLRLLLLAGFLLSLLVGIVALVGLYLTPELEQETAQVISQPVVLVEPDRIPPHLALLQLAGADGEALVRQAANAGERTLAFAILAYDGTLSPSRQAAEFLRVGHQFLAVEDPLRAAAAFERARAVTIFALPMPPLERGQLLIRSGEGLKLAGDGRGALESALQAQHVAAQAAGLLPAQRAQILQGAEGLIRAYGSEEEVRRLEELLRGPGQVRPRVALISRLAQLRGDYPLPANLAEIQAEREAAAQALIDRLLLTGGQDIEPERAALAELLLVEDRLWTELYAGWNNPGLALADRHDLLLGYRQWLLVKLRVAEGGFGLRLVENWRVEMEAIRGGLARVMGEMNALLTAQIGENSDPASRAVLQLEALQWLGLQAELGFYPQAPLGDISSRMEQTQAELERLNVPPDLPIFYDLGAYPPGFRIARRYE